MAVWSVPDPPASERIFEAHRLATGTEPIHAADAPGTFVVTGENADHYGGVTLVGLAQARTAVAVSPRDDATVAVTASFPGRKLSDAAQGSDIAAIGDPGFTAFGHGDASISFDESSDDDAPEKAGLPAGTDGLALRFGGLIHTLVGRQLLSRETAGMNITVESDIPLGAGLGALHAADVALGVALLADDTEINAAPLRTRLAEIASQAARTFTATPVLRARHTAALRGAGETIAVVDYADGSVTQAPHPARSGVTIFSVAAEFDAPFIDPEHTVAKGRAFIDDACANFGVSSLRQLPDAADRVVEWVDARHQVYGADSAPALETARAWVTFSEAETSSALAAAKALRSMRSDDMFTALADTARHPDLPVPDQLTQLLSLRGARAARPAAAGMSQAVIAYVPEDRAGNFAADLADDGLSVIEIGSGAQASVLS